MQSKHWTDFFFLALWRMVRANQAGVRGENAKELSAAVLVATQASSHDPAHRHGTREQARQRNVKHFTQTGFSSVRDRRNGPASPSIP